MVYESVKSAAMAGCFFVDIPARTGKEETASMLSSFYHTGAARRATALIIVRSTIVALIVVALSAASSVAAPKHRRPVVVVYPRQAVSPYAPYYYSAWNPRSIYSIYDHLSGGRQQCYLPSEPCDDNHSIQN